MNKTFSDFLFLTSIFYILICQYMDLCTGVSFDFDLLTWSLQFCPGHYSKLVHDNLSIFYMVIGQYMDVCTGMCFPEFLILTMTYWLDLLLSLDHILGNVACQLLNILHNDWKIYGHVRMCCMFFFLNLTVWPWLCNLTTTTLSGPLWLVLSSMLHKPLKLHVLSIDYLSYSNSILGWGVLARNSCISLYSILNGYVHTGSIHHYDFPMNEYKFVWLMSPVVFRELCYFILNLHWYFKLGFIMFMYDCLCWCHQV